MDRNRYNVTVAPIAPSSDEATAQQGLQGRLVFLLETCSQAELSRKTGASKMSISRYVAGARIPADFCVAIVEKMGVNPAWLLTGQGVPYLSGMSIAADADAMKGDLLSMVQAMTAISHMKIGALADKPDMRNLRELEETVQVFHRYRDRLNMHVRELADVFARDILKAFQEKHYALAETLLATAKQVLRLGDLPEHTRRLRELEAALEQVRGHVDRSLEIRREVFLQALAQAGKLDRGLAYGAALHALALHTNCRYDEAQRTCRAALALLPPGLEPVHHALACLLGMSEAMSGRLDRGLRRLQRSVPFTPPDVADMTRAYLGAALALSGGVSPLELAAMMKGDMEFRVSVAIRLACLLEDFAALRDLLRIAHPETAAQDGSAATEWRFARTHALLDILDEPGEAAFRQFQHAVADSEAGMNARGMAHVLASNHIALCQAARLAGLYDLAHGYWQTAARMSKELPPGVTLSIIDAALHHRNAQMLFGGEKNQGPAKAARALRNANRFFRRCAARGYGSFATFA